MPRQPSPTARFGTRFHAWVEARFGQQSLLDPDDLPGRADLGIDDESDLKQLTERFASGPFGQRAPLAIEPPFALVLDRKSNTSEIQSLMRISYAVYCWKKKQQQ